MFLSCKPAVTVINEEYELLINTVENGVISVLVGDEVFYEENSGVLASEKNYAKIRVPQCLLDREKKYTVAFRKSLERVAYWSKLGEEQRELFRFKPVKKRGEINAYHLADIHGRFNSAKKAAAFFGKNLDLLLLNGDYCELDSDEDYLKLFRFIGELTEGKIPVVLVRGNHDCRGTAAEKYTDRLTSNGSDTYYTFKAGWLRGVALDLGEDKRDEGIEYGGTNNFYAFRRRETAFLKKLKGGKNQPLFAIGHASPGYNTSRKGDAQFDIEDELYTEWNKELERLDIKFMIIGHFHKAFFLKKNDERSRRPHSYPIIVGSELASDSFCGTALTFSGNTLTVRITNTEKEVKATAYIDLLNGNLYE